MSCSIDIKWNYSTIRIPGYKYCDKFIFDIVILDWIFVCQLNIEGTKCKSNHLHVPMLSTTCANEKKVLPSNTKIFT